jgi:hypothetical protein
MRSPISAAVLIATTCLLFACKPKPEPVQVAEEEPTEESNAAPQAEMVEACRVSLSEPEQHDWTTYWDTSAELMNGASPSSAQSIYWANPEEVAELIRSKSAVTLELRCSSSGPPAIAMSLAAYGSSTTDVPRGSGEYPVVGSYDALKPGMFLAGTVSLDQRTFLPASGTISIDRFDMEGVRGSFRIEGKESGENGEQFRLSGDFNIPCRGGRMEGLCEATQTAAP